MAAKKRRVLRDIWLYAGLLGAITGVIGLLLTSFSLRILLPVALVCVVGAGLLTAATLERFHLAHRRGTAPDTTRIFE